MQNPVTAARRASAATIPPRTAPAVAQPARYASRGGAEEREADHVREPRRAAVLERPLAESRLQHLEVEDACEAPASPEGEAERELEREQREQQPPARQHREQARRGRRRPGSSAVRGHRSPRCRGTDRLDASLCEVCPRAECRCALESLGRGQIRASRPRGGVARRHGGRLCVHGVAEADAEPDPRDAE